MPQAAQALGITEGAVRGRIKRDTLRSHREAGTVYVVLEGSPSAVNRDESVDSPTEQSELMEELREELGTERTRREMAEATLHEGMAEEQRRREEAQRERDALRRELFASREPPEAAQTVEVEPERAEPQPEASGAQEGVQSPWWRRVFGR